MKLSVIIPTRNRAKLLEESLLSIANQSLQNNYFEVIVVNNGSTDETKKVVDVFKEKIPHLRYLYDETPGLHVGRHKGMINAKSDILVFCDDDIEASPIWLEEILKSFENSDAVLVGGKNLPKFEIEPPDWILKMWEKGPNGKVIFYLSILDFGDEMKEINPYYVFGCNFSIRKSILLEAGGFHPDSMPEELIKYRGDGESHVSSFILKRSYKALYNPKATVYHFVSKERMTKEYFAKRAFNQGVSDSYTDIRNWNNRNLFIMKLKSFLKKCILRDSYIEEHYLKGYYFHQNLAKKDPLLMEWIKRENYIENWRIV